MPETQKNPTAPGPADTPEAQALFQLLLSGKRDPAQVYTAMRAVKSMVGQSVVAQLTALIRATAAEQKAAIAELTAQLQTTNTRLDSVEKQLGRIWTFLCLLLGTLLGTLTTLLTTLLLKG